MSPLISVALCTHNGARWLPELLSSLEKQSRLPDELVVCDDASSDQTLSVIHAFAQQAPFRVVVHESPERLGIVSNFERAIGYCRGRHIFLADQDDVWNPSKIGRMIDALTRENGLAAFSDADVVGPDLTPLGYTLWQHVGMSESMGRAFHRGEGWKCLLRRDRVTGATLGFSRDLLQWILPFPSGWPHDAWIGLVAAALGKIHPIPLPLILYRQHGGNAVGGKRKRMFAQLVSALKTDRSAWYQSELRRWEAAADRLEMLRGLVDDRPVLEEIRGKVEHLHRRRSFPVSRLLRIPEILGEMRRGGYRRYGRNWGSIALDMFLP